MLVTDLSQNSSPSLQDYLLGAPASTEYYKTLISDLAKVIVESYAGSSLAGSSQSVKNAVNKIYDLIGTGPGFHNSFFRGKSLGSSITTAQNNAIKNRTYDDMFIGDYWTINSHVWRIGALDYYYNVGDTAFSKGNIIVVPDSILYRHQMAYTESGGYEAGSANTTNGGYSNSYGFTTGLNQARTIAANDFGAHVAAHRIICTSATSGGKPSSWAWRDSDGVELMNEIQVYGTKVWGAGDQNGYDVGSQKTQLPLFRISPTHINIRTDYWLQDVQSAPYFALVHYDGRANGTSASYSSGVRPAVTITYT